MSEPSGESAARPAAGQRQGADHAGGAGAGVSGGHAPGPGAGRAVVSLLGARPLVIYGRNRVLGPSGVLHEHFEVLV